MSLSFNPGRNTGTVGLGNGPAGRLAGATGAQPGTANTTISTSTGIPKPSSPIQQPAGNGADLGGGPVAAPANNFFAQQAANYAPGSAMAQFWGGFANNPSAANGYNAQQSIQANLPGGAAYSQPLGAAPAYPGGVPLGASPNAVAGQPAGLGVNTPTPAPGAVVGTLSGNGPAAPAAPQTTGGTPGAFAPGSVNQGPAQQNTPDQSLQNNLNWLGPLLSMFGMGGGGGYGGYGMASPGALWSQLFGGGPQIPQAPGSSTGGTDLSQLFNMFGQPGVYNPYGLPLYSRQQQQWPQFA